MARLRVRVPMRRLAGAGHFVGDLQKTTTSHTRRAARAGDEPALCLRGDRLTDNLKARYDASATADTGRAGAPVCGHAWAGAGAL
jgi:hypothetical protein